MSERVRRARRTLLKVHVPAVAALAVLWAAPGAAVAATPLGQLAPGAPADCGGTTVNLVQDTIASGTSYEVPAPGGVITKWSHKEDADGGFGRLQVWRRAGGSSFTLVGRSEIQATAPSAVNEYPTRIPVSAGDLLGLRSAVDTFACLFSTGMAGDVIRGEAPASDPAPGETRSLFPSGGTDRVNVAATLEPDADGDGYGDESQDQCPTNATTQLACPASSGTGVVPAAGPTGQRAAALKKCKKKKSKKARKKCKQRASKLPV